MSRQSNFDVAASRAYLRSRQERAYQAAEQRRHAALHAICAAARAVFPNFPGVRRAYVFGSALRPGAMRADSDIDVAIEGALSAEEYFALWRELEKAASDWTIDLVELDREVRFADSVRKEGMLIYERPDPDVEHLSTARDGTRICTD
ncbi:MAG: nucleotidyltransferase domain-containing protein [Roseiflexus sp.]|nr:nucleotidyltransferase domain-containing protein [Roseiflexus sp.]